MRARLFTAPPQPNLLQPFAEYPPVAGMDDNVPLYNMPAGTAVYLYNLVPGSYGVVSREGYQVWAINLSGGEVKSLVPFAGAEGSGNQARIFAATQNGLFDVSTRGADNPAAVVTYPQQTVDAGFISYLSFTDPTGSQTLLMADSVNGMYEYQPVGATWTKLSSTQIQNVDVTKVAFLTLHKGRIWMIERDSADAWYLPIGQKYGEATKFQFGSKFSHGGELVGLYSWTVDGGQGIDDYLVAVSRAGDVLIYQGDDPAIVGSWGVRGRWFIGQVPKGRRIATETGGDMAVLSVFGAISLSALLQGLEPSRIERNITGKVSRLVQDELRRKLDQNYWQFVSIPEEEVLAINTPVTASERPIQFVLNINRLTEGRGGGWALWRDVPATVWEPYLGNAFFGTKDGRVCRMTGGGDEVPFDNLSSRPIEFSALGRFSDYEAPAYYKQVQWIRPTFRAENIVTFTSKAIYDFNIGEIIPFPVASTGTGSLWDVANWDQAFWEGSSPRTLTLGGGGYGRNVAIAVRGETTARATLMNVEGAWQPWNIL